MTNLQFLHIKTEQLQIIAVYNPLTNRLTENVLKKILKIHFEVLLVFLSDDFCN